MKYSSKLILPHTGFVNTFPDKPLCIAFFVGCFENGRHGIGDHVRRLAPELSKQGCNVAVLALNDDYVLAIPGFIQELLEPDVPCLRVSSRLSWRTRMELARNFLDTYPASVFSLQYCPHSFDKKGLPIGLFKRLSELPDSGTWHVMFQELWIHDFTKPLSVKKRLLGFIQKLIVRRGIPLLKPVAIHTHMMFYQSLLKSVGIRSDLLPIFGNVPCVSQAVQGREWIYSKLLISGDWFLAGFFGNVPDNLDFVAIREFFCLPKFTGKRICITSAGYLPLAAQCTFLKLRECLLGLAHVKAIGEISELEVSYYLSGLDLGLSAYPPEIVGKSSSISTMIEHQLDVYAFGTFMGAPFDLSKALLKPESFQPVEEFARSFVCALSSSP